MVEYKTETMQVRFKSQGDGIFKITASEFNPDIHAKVGKGAPAPELPKDEEFEEVEDAADTKADKKSTKKDK
jgi:hypothetical protein